MTIASIGIIGAGTMGTGIMINAVTSGFDVMLVDRSDACLAKAEAALARFLARQVEKGRLTETAAAEARYRLSLSRELQELAPSDLVIEAVFEDLAVKRGVMAELEEVVSPTTIIASNTSSLLIGDIGAHMQHRERLCGLHYFSPAEINPVVELVRSAETHPRVIARLAPFLSVTGRQIVQCTDAPGFALNRFFCPYLNEAVRLADEGIGTAGEIDAVARVGLGVPLGPFAVSNIIKSVIVLRAVESLAPLGAFYAPAAGLVRQGRDGGPWEIAPDAAHPGGRRAAVIEDRLRGALYLPLCELRAARIADPEEIDCAAQSAFRFPEGLFAQMARLGPEEVSRLIDRVGPAQAAPA